MSDAAAGSQARTLDGKAVAQSIRDEVARGVVELRERTGVAPGLTVVLVGQNPASQVYVRNKEKAAAEVGMRSEVVRLPTNVSEGDLLARIDSLNADPQVHGILVQLPLPGGIDEHRVIEWLDPAKDVDGFHPVNVGRLSIGLPGLAPCTPAGIIELLRRYDIPLRGRHAVVVGRSNIVGKPMAQMLLREHCTVTICHSRTQDLDAVCALADVLVVAAGKAGLIGGRAIRAGAVVVDVGMHSLTEESEVRRIFGDDPRRLKTLLDKGSALAGDVVQVEARERAAWLTPVPGGVGPLTIALLLRNALDAARTALR